MRPGKGNTGKPCIVKAIHFFAALPDKDLHQYDVTITPTNKIVEGQQSSKRLSERQITALLKVTCQRPLEREKDILRTVALNNYKDYPYSKEFGIKISTSLASVEARILPPPWLKYHDSGREGTCFPQVGQWNMMNKKMINGGTVNNWFCIIFSRQVQDNLAWTFCQELAQMCYVSGIVSLPKHNLINVLGL